MDVAPIRPLDSFRLAWELLGCLSAVTKAVWNGERGTIFAIYLATEGSCNWLGERFAARSRVLQKHRSLRRGAWVTMLLLIHGPPRPQLATDGSGTIMLLIHSQRNRATRRRGCSAYWPRSPEGCLQPCTVYSIFDLPAVHLRPTTTEISSQRTPFASLMLQR